MQYVLMFFALMALMFAFAFWKEVLKFAIGAGVLGVILYFVVKQHG
jgi:hypothetical protein